MAKENEIKIVIQVATAEGKAEIKDFTGTADKELKGLSGNAKKYLGMAGLAGLIASATGTVVAGFNRSIDAGSTFEQQLADLQAITGIAGRALKELGDTALENSVRTGVSARDQVEAYKLLAGSIDMAMIGGVEGLKRLGRETITLSQAAGVDLATAANTVASTMNQWSLAGNESARVVNVLAAGSAEGAAEVEDLSLALKNAGTSAALSNQSLETTVAALEILAENALKGSEAGTGLRNVLTILQSSTARLARYGIHDINLQGDGLVATLQKLRPLLEDNAALAEIFGRHSLNAASILIANAEAVGEMEKRVTGTNTAMEQQTIQTDTYQGAVARLTETINKQLIEAFQQTGGVMVDLINFTAQLVEEFGGFISVISEFLDRHSELKRALEEEETATDNQVEAMRELRKILAEAASEGNLTAQQQQELRQSYEQTTEILQQQQDALADTMLQEGLRRAQIEQSIQTIEDAIRSGIYYGQSLTNAQMEVNRLRQQLSGLDLSLASQQARYDELSEAIREGSISFEEFVKRLQNTGDGQQSAAVAGGKFADQLERIRASLNQMPEHDLIPGLREAVKEMKELTEQEIFDAPKIDFTQAGSADWIREQMRIVSEEIGKTAPGERLDELREKLRGLKEDLDDVQGSTTNVSLSWEDVAASSGQAAAQQILYADSAKDAIRGIIKAISAEIIAKAILSAFTPPTPASLFLAPIAAAGATSLISSLIPSFRTGVDDFSGGLAKVHAGEVITHLPPGSNVLTNANVQRLERLQRSRPNLSVIDRMVDMSRAQGREDGTERIIAKMEEQTRRLEAAERNINLRLSEFDEQYNRFKDNETIQGRQ